MSELHSVAVREGDKSLSEQKAYDAMISLFYGKMFGLVPQHIINDIDKTFNEMGTDFNTHCVKEEGWFNIEQVYEFVIMIKSMSKKDRNKYIAKCPSKLLKQFIKKELV